MRAFVVIVLLLILFLVFVNAGYSDTNLTPYGTPAAQANLATPTPWSPLPTVTGNAQPQNQGVPVTGAVPNTTTYYYPPVALYTGYVGIPVTGGCSNPYVVQTGDFYPRWQAAAERAFKPCWH